MCRCADSRGVCAVSSGGGDSVGSAACICCLFFRGRARLGGRFQFRAAGVSVQGEGGGGSAACKPWVASLIGHCRCPVPAMLVAIGGGRARPPLSALGLEHRRRIVLWVYASLALRIVEEWQMGACFFLCQSIAYQVWCGYRYREESVCSGVAYVKLASRDCVCIVHCLRS